MSDLKEELEQLKMFEKKAVEKVRQEVNNVLDEMNQMRTFLKAWEEAIGKENIEKTTIRRKTNGIIQRNRFDLK